MLLLVSFIGWIVVRYARTYIDGEARQGAFTGWLCATLAAVLLLVQAGASCSWSWPGSRRPVPAPAAALLPRPARRRSGRRGRALVVARAGDVALVGASVLLFAGFGTADIAGVLDAPGGRGARGLLPAAGLIALAAVL